MRDRRKITNYLSRDMFFQAQNALNSVFVCAENP